MGAFDKFRSADKLFWDSSGRIINNLNISIKFSSNNKSKHFAEDYRVLNKYYSEYGIDLFDIENIDRLFDFHLFSRDTQHSDIYNTLKEIQRQSTDYVTDYRSYEKCLKEYYDIHGEDTEWLVKIFAERYDLDRFNITSEDVLDDLHEIMTTTPKISTLKKNNSLDEKLLSKSKDEWVSSTKNTDTRTSNTKQSVLIDATALFNEVKTMPIKFDYTAAFTGKCEDINTICSTFMSERAIKSAMNDDVILNLERSIQAKRSRNPRKADHDKSMEVNVLFEMYKYSYLMNTIIALEKHKHDTITINYQNYWSMIQHDCMNRLKNLEQEKRKYPEINTVLRRYANDNRTVSMRMLSQINARENDYIIAGLMTNVLNMMLYSIFSGATIQLSNSSSQQKVMQIIQKYPSKEVCMIIDSCIVNTVVLRTSIYGGGGSPLGWN